MMIDLHTHSLFSDGVLIPSELARRGEALGLEAMAISDHIDISNMDFVIPRLVKTCQHLNNYLKIKVIPGAEITHVPPGAIGDLVKEARSMGAKVVLVHGETITEPVMAGTNRAAIEAGVDILAHPGLISEEEVRLAGEKGVALEISGRRGHSITNGHVAALAEKIGTDLIFNSDAHAPSDLVDFSMAEKMLYGAGLREERVVQVFQNSRNLLKKIDCL